MSEELKIIHSALDDPTGLPEMDMRFSRNDGKEVIRLGFELTGPAMDCYNACAAINKDDPVAVAKGLKELVDAARAYRARNLALDEYEERFPLTGAAGARIDEALAAIRGDKDEANQEGGE